MPYNRYTKSRQISEEDFVGIVFDYALGLTPSACAERIEVSEKTVRKYFEKLRVSLLNAFLESGDSKFNSIFLSLNEEDWDKVYFCMFECPNNVVEDYPFAQIDSNPLLSKKLQSRNFRVTKKKKLGKCTKCELLHPFDIHEEFAFDLAFRMTAGRGSLRSKFSEVFLGEFLRLGSLGVKPDTDRDSLLMVRTILFQCEKTPL